MTWLSPPFTEEMARTLIEEIRCVTNSSEVGDIDLFRELTAQYGEWCSMINERLEACHRLLERGFVSEAVEETVRAPSVLDLAELMDFPETSRWLALIASQGLATPPTIKLEIAADLNAAFATLDSMAPLLAKYRMAALGRGDLKLRLELIRRLRRAMPSNPGWMDDQKAMETARLKEIAAELEQQRTLEEIRSLARELEDNDWIVPVAPSLMEHARKTLDRLERYNSVGLADDLFRELLAAFQAEDVDRANAARDRLNALAFDATSELLSGDAADRVQEAVRWLDEQNEQRERQRRFQSLTAQLERLLDEDAGSDVLERVYSAMERLELPIPAVVERRYRARIESASLEKVRKYRLVFVSLILILIGSGFGVWYYVRESAHRRIAQAATVQMEKLIEEKNYSGARQVYQQLTRDHPWVASNPKLAAIKQRLDQREEADKSAEMERLAAFRAALEQAKHSDPLSPDQASLAKAESLAANHRERQMVEDVRREFQQAQLERRKQLDRHFREDYSKLVKEVRQLEKKLETDAAAVVSKLAIDRLDSDIAALMIASRQVSSELRDQALILRRRIASVREEYQIRVHQLEILKQVFSRQAVSSPVAYKNALKDFLQAEPNSVFAPSLRESLEVLELLPCWEKWLEWTSDDVFRNPTSASPAWAHRKIEEASELAKSCPDVPFASKYREKADLLAALAARHDSRKTPLLNELASLLEDPFFGETWMILLDNGKKYYLFDEPEEHPQSVRYVASLDFSRRETSIPGNSRIVYRGLSPHRKKLEQIARTVKDGIPPTDWGPRIAQWMHDIHSDPNMDSFVKYFLIRKLATIGSKGSLVVQSSMRTLLQQELSQELPDIDWLKDTDDVQQATADIESKLTASKGALSELRESQDLRRELDQLRELWHARIDWLGVVRRSSSTDGDPELACAGQPGDGQLAVLAGNRRNSKLYFVGHIASGKVRWNGESAALVKIGVPIFLVESSKPHRVASN